MKKPRIKWTFPWMKENVLGHPTEHVRSGYVDGHSIKLCLHRYSETTAQIWNATVFLDGSVLWTAPGFWSADGLADAKSSLLHEAHKALARNNINVPCRDCGDSGAA